MGGMVAATNLDEIAAIVFVDIAIIMVAARLMGALARKLRQPAVIGEIVAGLLLGPSLLGAFPGDLTTKLFPLEVRPFLKVVAQLGLIIFMFIVGLELDLRLIKGKERTAAVISLSSIALPFGFGLVLAGVLHGSHDIVGGTEVEFLPFALFIGASMSITAFPVLARILIERGMFRTQTGTLTLACAAVDDVVAWSLLALVLAVVASAGAWDLPRILLLSGLFVGGMVLIVRPLLERVVAERYRRTGRLTPDILAVILVGLLVSSFLTAQIGIHQIFGAFLFGALLPRDGTAGLFHEVLERLESVSVLLLLPVFFIATGLDANVRGIGLDGVGQLGLILLVAIAGKFIGAAVGARIQGIPGRQAATIGVLMNTRGLTELVILNVGLAFGVLDAQLFTMLVVMAIVTTVMTEPLLRLVYPDTMLARDIATAERAAVGAPDAYRVLVAVGDAAHAIRMADLAVDLVGRNQPADIVLTRFTPRATGGELGTGLVTELAEMEQSMGALRDLAARVEAMGVRCVLRYQFSDDVAGDLVAQAASVGAKVLVVGGPRASTEEGRLIREQFSERIGLDFDAFVGRVFKEAPCDVAVLVHPYGIGVPPSPDHPVAVAVGEGRNDPAAVELAVRIALTSGAEVRIVDAVDDRRGGRRLATLADEVIAAGAQAEVTRDAAGAALVVTGADSTQPGLVADGLMTGAGGAVLVVRAGPGEDRRGLGPIAERLHRIATSDAPTA